MCPVNFCKFLTAQRLHAWWKILNLHSSAEHIAPIYQIPVQGALFGC